jgi:hypothetical protein
VTDSLERRGRRAAPRASLAAALVLLAHCASGTANAPAQADVVPSHVYPLPLDNVLAQATTELEKKGWRVQRSGDSLVTNWSPAQAQSTQQLQSQASVAGAVVAYRISGERVDAGFSVLHIERVVATPSTLDFGQKRGGHVVEQSTTTASRSPTPVHNEQRTLLSAFGTEPEFEDNFESQRNTGVPSGMVVNQRERDATLELELRELIDPVTATTQEAGATVSIVPPTGLASAESSQPPHALDAVAPVGTSDEAAGKPIVPASSTRRPGTLAGIWTGTFTFRGKVTGSFSGEVSVAVDGETVEIDDFCPDSGGTVSTQASGTTAAWQGKLACPPIRLQGCPAAVVTYDFINALLNESTLTVVAAGTVNTGGRCLDSGGEMSVGGDLTVSFVAQRADYVHIAVSRAQRQTACVWPTDWEDFGSRGSMPMPEPAADNSAYLGIIRAKGSRLTEIQRLLRHCRQLVLLHGQPVVMRLAVTRSHP